VVTIHAKVNIPTGSDAPLEGTLGIGQGSSTPEADLSSPGVFSCVVDADIRFHLDALRWYAVLRTVAGVQAHDMVVHAVDGTDSEVLKFLRSEGVSVDTIQPFDTRPPPHCNKICGALRLAERGVEGWAVLTDTDIAVLEDPRRLRISTNEVASRIVGAPNPPLRILENVFAAAGLEVSGTESLDLFPEERTIAGHGNGGFYVIPAPMLATVAHSWAYWAKWLMDNVALLEDFPRHVDQPSMALALSDLGLTPRRLELRWNFPVHNPARIPSSPDLPAVLHYHRNVGPDGLLQQTGVAVVDEQIDRANAAIAEAWREVVPKMPASDAGSEPDGAGAPGFHRLRMKIRRRIAGSDRHR
jgi:hypothetical protein